MIFWRISRFHDLRGLGTVKTFGRWHVLGTRMVYTADSPTGALLEICTNTSGDDAPPSFTLLKIVGPDRTVEEVTPSALPMDWVQKHNLTQARGSEWLASGRSALLRVPSALVPESWNYLLNPLHAEAELFRIDRIYEYPFDLRLKS
jgi:RES domain-containing protein